MKKTWKELTRQEQYELEAFYEFWKTASLFDKATALWILIYKPKVKKVLVWWNTRGDPLRFLGKWGER